MSVDAGIQWFPSLGFRPAVWTASHRADGVDPQRLAVAPDADVALIGKFDAYAHIPTGYAWGTWIPASPAPQITAASLAGSTVRNPDIAHPWHPSTPSQPWWPSVPEPWFPCCIVQEPEPPLPEPAPVPLEASGLFLLTALAALWWWGRK